MAYYRCGPTAIGSRTSWGPVTSPADASYQRPLSGNYDRIFNAFERTNAFQYVRKDKEEDRQTGHGDVVVNRKSSSLERADCALAAQTPCDDDEEFYREKVLYSQARQLYPLQEDLADWINKTVGIDYITGENFLDVLDNGAELCQLAAVIHDRAREALHQGLLVGPVPQIRGRCWQRAARRSFFSRDNTENFITFCRDLGVHENLLFESDDLVLHNQPRQVILCLLEVARLATRFGLEPPGLVQLEKEIALEERDSGLDSAMSSAPWQFRDLSPVPDKPNTDAITLTSEPNDENQLSVVDDVDADARSEGTVASSDSDVPLKPTNELDKRVQLVTRLMERGCRCGSGRCDKLLKVKKVGEGRYNIAGRNVFIRLLKGRHMMVRVGGGWDTLEHFLSRHEPCQVRLVTQGRRPAPLPVPAPDPPRSARATPDPTDKPTELSTPNLKSPSSSSRSSLDGKTSPNSRSRQSLDGKTSPSRSRSSLDGKSSPEIRNPISSSTPKRKPQLTLPLKTTTEKIPVRTRKQSAPSFSTPTTPSHTAPAPPTARRTPSLTPKKSRSMSLALVKDDGKKPFCGTDRLNQGAKKTRPASVAIAPVARKTRSQSLASTPVNEPKKTFTNGFARKTRSMSLANPVEPVKLLNKSQSVTSQGGLTQAAIEESIRRSLAATLTEDCPTKPFLHIKAKYRSPPPREVPPR